MRKTTIAAVLAAGLAVPAAASAHVTVQPREAAAGAYARLDVRVPNERDDAGTRQVAVQMPPGVLGVSYEPEPGWSARVRNERLSTPIESEDGEEVTEQVDTVTFTADEEDAVIRPGEFRDFGLSMKVPGKPGETLIFKAVQTYDSGEVVRWIGPEDADQPAARVVLTEAADEGGHAAATAPPGGGGGEQAAAPPAATEDDGASEGLVFAALAVGGLGLLAGLAGLVAARGARARGATA